MSKRDHYLLRIASEQSESDRASAFWGLTDLIYSNEETEMENIKTLLPYICEFSSASTAKELLRNIQQDNMELASQKELIIGVLRELRSNLVKMRNLISETEESVKDFELKIDVIGDRIEGGVATSAEGEESKRKLSEDIQETSDLVRTLTHGSGKSIIRKAKEFCRNHTDKVEEMKRIVEERFQQCIEEISKMKKKLHESRYDNAKEVAYLLLYGDDILNDHLAIRSNRQIYYLETITSTGKLVNKVHQDTWDDVLRLPKIVKADRTFLLIASIVTVEQSLALRKVHKALKKW